MAGGVSGGGMTGRGCVWQVGHAWQEGGCAWQGGMHVRGRAWHAHPPARYYEIGSMSGRYASYWNAYLLSRKFILAYSVT